MKEGRFVSGGRCCVLERLPYHSRRRPALDTDLGLGARNRGIRATLITRSAAWRPSKECVVVVVRRSRVLRVKFPGGKKMHFFAAVTTVAVLAALPSLALAAAGQFDSALSKRSDGRSDCKRRGYFLCPKKSNLIFRLMNYCFVNKHTEFKVE